MRTNAFTCVIALAICAALAGCGKDADRDMAKDLSRATPPPQPTTSAPQQTPANAGPPSSSEKQDGGNPVQGQVDPKQPEQQKDFQKSN